MVALIMFRIKVLCILVLTIIPSVGMIASPCFTIIAGPLLDPATWNCNCDPHQCDSLIIGHVVTYAADEDLLPTYTRILPGGALIGQHRLQLTGRLENDGMIQATWFWLHGGDDLVNNGTIASDVFITLKDSSFNYGMITCPDSLVVGWSRRMHNEGAISAGVFYQLGAMNNLGDIDCVSAYLRPFANFQNLIVSDTLYAAAGLINEGMIGSGQLYVNSYFDNFGTVNNLGTFWNGAVIASDTRIFAGGSIITRDLVNPVDASIRGPGTLCIEDHSENHGWIYGPIDICDLTPTSSTAPFMDVHTGGVSNPIYQCVNTLCTTLGVEEPVYGGSITTYPNPAVERITVELGTLAKDVHAIVVVDAVGRDVRTVVGQFTDRVFIARDGLPAGIYTLLLTDRQGRRLGRVRFVFAEDR